MTIYVRQTEEETYVEVKSYMRRCRKQSVEYKSQMAGGTVTVTQLEALVNQWDFYIGRFGILGTGAFQTANPDFAAVAQEKERDVAYDVYAEYAAMVLLLQDCIDTIQAINTDLFITGWNGNVLIRTAFNSATTTPLQADLQAVIDATVLI